jgi:hypothetical protein
MRILKALLLALSLAAALASSSSSALAAPAAPSQAWSLDSTASPTVFRSGEESGVDVYEVVATNSGGAPTDRSQITITDTLPVGVAVNSVEFFTSKKGNGSVPGVCEHENPPGEAATVTCEITESTPGAAEPALLYPSEGMRVAIHLSVPSSVDGPLTNKAEIEGGGAEPATTEFDNEADPLAQAKAGLQVFRAELLEADGSPATGADTHPYQYTTSFAVNSVLAPPGSLLPFIPAEGDLRNVEVELPPGLIANPTATERCSAQEFNTIHSVSGPLGQSLSQNECPEGSAVGLAVLRQFEGVGALTPLPIYNLLPPPGMPAQFGIQPAFGLPIYINTTLRSDGDYGASGFVREVTQAKRVTAASFTFWGTPADSSHDRLRGNCVDGVSLVGFSLGECDAGIAERPFFRLPSSCADPLVTTMSFDTWAQPSAVASASVAESAPVGCAAPDFSPTIQAQPTTNVADSPAGFHYVQHLPQAENEKPEEPGEADVRDATVTLPRGLVVNPASADGLQACSPTQVGLTSALGAAPIRFNKAPASCPAAAKVGVVQALTPLLDHPVEGAVYVAEQERNPFKSLLAIYIVLEDPPTGTVVKIAAKVTPDPVTGQLSTTVKDIPQLPVEDFTFDFFAGARASLRTPAACGTHTTNATLVPWTAPEGPTAARASSFQISAGPEGPCPSGALAPKLSAGFANPTVGTYSPFTTRLSRADGSDEFAGLTVKPPLGLTAKLAGIPYCPDAAIAQASARNLPGSGALEANHASCPAASRVGSATAGAGAGPTPFFTGGPIYLAGPYKGAPLSFVAIVPAVAGPFDLGVVVNRIAAHINTETAQVSAEADPLPRILSGIPLDARDIRADFDRPGFTLAPTSCEPKSVEASVLGVSGASATVSDRFQLGGCPALGFKPGISLKLKGPTRRAANPALKAVVTYPKGAYANVARASVAFPHSEFLDQAHIRTICTRVQFAADACPKGAIYGRARAITPLLDKPLEGPVYLRSSSNPLPDLVMALEGQLDFDAVGRVDSHNGGIRVTFDTVPDAPLTKVVVEMQGGKKGLLVNSRNICNHPNRATAKLTAHNGKTHNFRPLLRDECGKGKAGKKRSGS